MRFHPYQKDICQVTPQLMFNDDEMERVDSFNFLWLTIDKHLNWKQHNEIIATKLSKYCGILAKLKNYLPTYIIRTIYFSRVPTEFWISTMGLKPRSHLTDLTADLSRPWWSGEVLWSRREIGKDGWVLEGPERSVKLVEVSPTVPDCFELFKTIGSGRGWRAVVDRALGRRVRSLEGCYVSVTIVGKGRAWSVRNQDGHRNRPPTTE